MRRMAVLCFAAGLVVMGWGSAAADEAEDLYEEIRKAGDVQFDRGDKDPEVFRAELVAHLTKIINLAENYRKRFPTGAELNEVLYESARAYFYMSRVQKPAKEFLDKGVSLANESINLAPRAAAAAKSRGLLIVYHKALGELDKVLEQAQTIVRDFENSETLGPAYVPLALLYVGDTYQAMGKEEEAVKAYERLVKEFPDDRYAARAAGILAYRKLKGSTLELQFTSVTGESIDMKNYRGKVVLIDFWAPAAPSIQRSAAVLVRLNELLQDKGLRILGVCMDTSKEEMESCIKKTGMTWPQHFDGKKWDNAVARQLGINTFPTRVLVDKTGKVREIGLTGRELQETLRKLLDE